ncbi:MAG: type II secretion system F family protein [Verrucomicrobia bacterium]|nr:type II secretion system F family protein [Verrucomicrobiota bacterium]MBV9130159.1 type II secretion system F family protein [Verrucomicrobiota bacterium]MBV9298596.1 type II secretion system F family protein [Verrucomicrobiota bacterium]MBV9645751.1 type II secretion system F family protein [Verrucomicrobiota bacterium]
MAVFSYNAVSRDGGRVSGQVEAQSRAEAFRKLDRDRLQPISLVQQDGGEPGVSRVKATDEPVATRNIRLSGSQIILFTEEMSDLLDAGMQLEPALRVMESRKELSSIKSVASALRQQVREGSSLSHALRLVCPSFGDLFCNLVAAGELSGSLPQLLRRQATFLVTLDDLRKKVVSALIYPAMIFVLGIGLIFLFMSYLVPQLTTLFQKTGRDLPLLTRLLVQTSDVFSHYWWAFVGGVAVTVFCFLQLIRTVAGRRWWHRTQLQLPLFGSVLRGRFYAQFSETMANLIANGIPLLNSLQLMTSAIGNLHLRGLMEKVVEMVREGGSLSRALQRVGEFPPLFIDMIAVGEQTGDLARALGRVGRRYDKELNIKIQRLTALVQPVVILVMAGMVGVIAYSIINGIFDAVAGLRPQ